MHLSKVKQDGQILFQDRNFWLLSSAQNHSSVLLLKLDDTTERGRACWSANKQTKLTQPIVNIDREQAADTTRVRWRLPRNACSKGTEKRVEGGGGGISHRPKQRVRVQQAQLASQSI